MLYIEVDEFTLHDLMKKAGRDNFSEEGYEWIINEYYDCFDEEFDAVAIDSTFTECDISEAVEQYGYLMNPEDYKLDDGSVDPWLFVCALSDFTRCDLLSNDKIIYEEF